MAFSLSNPTVKGIAATVGLAFAEQAAFASVAVPKKTEKKYVHGTALPSLLSFHPRQLILSAFTAVWASRLGYFLFQRIKRTGKDSRFDEIKQSAPKFFGAWLMQGLWISLTASPTFVINSIPKASQPPLGPRDYLGMGIWLSAFAFEVIADRQKSQWREGRDKKQHDEKFITSGLCYVGEVSLWAGQAIVAANAVARSPSVPTPLIGLVAVSPLLEFALIRFISGVPLLEESSDKKFGDDPAYQEYKKRTPVFFPKLF